MRRVILTERATVRTINDLFIVLDKPICKH